jgi:hypothetical protein
MHVSTWSTYDASPTLVAVISQDARQLPAHWPEPHKPVQPGMSSVARLQQRTIGREKKEEQCRRSSRRVDSGETPRIPLRIATLPNHGMWTNEPNHPHPWTTHPHAGSVIPKPCGQSARLSPFAPQLSTCTYTLLSTLCAPYPHRRESYPQFHPQFAPRGVRTPLQPQTTPIHWGKPEESVDSL